MSEDFDAKERPLNEPAAERVINKIRLLNRGDLKATTEQELRGCSKDFQDDFTLLITTVKNEKARLLT